MISLIGLPFRRAISKGVKRFSTSVNPQPVMTYAKGLAGVAVGETAICTVQGGEENDGLFYRGYTLEDLCSNCEWEEETYLLTRGKLPNRDELGDYRSKLEFNREIPDEIKEILEKLPENTHPM